MKKIIIALMMAAAVCLTGCQHNTPSDAPIYTGVNTASIKNSTGKTIALCDDTSVFAIVENGCTEDLQTAEKLVTILFGYDKDDTTLSDYWLDFNVTTSIELYICTDGKPYYSSI